MTRRQFRKIAAVRLPHPEEAVAFAEGQGWALCVSGSGRVYVVGPLPCDKAARTLAAIVAEPSYAKRLVQTLEARALLYDAAGWSLNQGERH